MGESTLRIDSQTDLIEHRLANGMTPLLPLSRGAKAPAAITGHGCQTSGEIKREGECPFNELAILFAYAAIQSIGSQLPAPETEQNKTKQNTHIQVFV